MNSHNVVTNPILLEKIATEHNLSFDLATKKYNGNDKVNTIGEPLPTTFETDKIKYRLKRIEGSVYLVFGDK